MIFILREVFAFESAVTVLVGDMIGDRPRRIEDVEATVFLCGKVVGGIRLDCERMPGPEAGPAQCCVETRDVVEWSREHVEAGAYELRW